jgi:NADH:ubiquinone oxidoreductase subunit
MNIGTWLFTRLRGRQVGSDAAGNLYYEEKRSRPGSLRKRRWVVYAGPAEASAVPPEWHAWLHYTTDAPLPDTGRKPWQKPHLANLTGTPLSYRPPGHDYEGGNRARATGDYEAWTPS